MVSNEHSGIIHHFDMSAIIRVFNITRKYLFWTPKGTIPNTTKIFTLELTTKN